MIFIKINAVNVLATYTIEIWYKSPPHFSTIIIGRITHTAAAPVCLSSNDKNRNLFFKITDFVVPGLVSFFCSGLGSLIVKIKPMINDAALIMKINFRSLAIPAAAIPANHPKA